MMHPRLIHRLRRIGPLVLIILVGILIAYVDDFGFLSEVFKSGKTCDGYAFGDFCQFCGLQDKNGTCEPKRYERDWNCVHTDTHKYLGARCTFVCVTGVRNGCAGVEKKRCFLDLSLIHI